MLNDHQSQELDNTEHGGNHCVTDSYCRKCGVIRMIGIIGAIALITVILSRLSWAASPTDRPAAQALDGYCSVP